MQGMWAGELREMFRKVEKLDEINAEEIWADVLAAPGSRSKRFFEARLPRTSHG